MLVAQKVVLAPPEHSAGAATQSQDAFGFEPVQVWCAGHAAVEVTTKQPSPSAPHVMSAPLESHA